jgi:hypothetical protein
MTKLWQHTVIRKKNVFLPVCIVLQLTPQAIKNKK